VEEQRPKLPAACPVPPAHPVIIVGSRPNGAKVPGVPSRRFDDGYKVEVRIVCSAAMCAPRCSGGVFAVCGGLRRRLEAPPSCAYASIV